MYWKNRRENQSLFRQAAGRGFFILKVTTTVISTMSDILELAILHCVYHNHRFYSDRHYHAFIKPDRGISDKTLKKNGIQRESLENGKSIVDVYHDVKSFLGESPFLISYGSFDIEKLKVLYESQGDELTISGEILMKDICKDILCECDTPDMKFLTVTDIFQIPQHENLYGLSYVLRIKWLMNAVMTKLWEPREKDLVKAQVYGIAYYPGFKGMMRLYVNTSEGTIYYDLIHDKWMSKEKGSNLTGRIDMQDIENQVFALAKCKNYQELKKFKGEAGYGKR